MTPFSALLKASGLSQQEAVIFLSDLKIKRATVNHWVHGRKYRRVPDEVLDEMAGLVRQIVNAVDAARELAEQGGHVEIACSRTDEEAQTHGWACLSHERVACGTILAAVPRACLVSRDGTSRSEEKA